MPRIAPENRRTSFNRPVPVPPPEPDAPAVLTERIEGTGDGDWDVTLEYAPGARAQVNLAPEGLSAENLADVQRWLASLASRWR